ncbi:MAG: hypothetical protein VKL60_15065 [Sphaerospermopsis sp.]|nr:hypothetical protein [Sphaerospermopsis sp.]
MTKESCKHDHWGRKYPRTINLNQIDEFADIENQLKHTIWHWADTHKCILLDSDIEDLFSKIANLELYFKRSVND